ncbi:MAG TPA: PE-PPE domain-containing protein [Mycobacterium sp.]|nr:PE-PPE domain-containing protein [Mycobacterium sp.]
MRIRRGRSQLVASGLAGAAIAGSALLGTTSTLQSAQVVLTDTAQAYYLRGTDIGRFPPDAEFAAYVDSVINVTAGPHLPAQKINYPASFWPVSAGYLSAPTYNASVHTGLQAAHAALDGQSGAIVFGYSQGAVVATEYKRQAGAVGDTYVLLANPNRPNGGILERFSGITIPILGISFNGATPTGGDVTYDIARQYDGWADFPKYPLNLLADINALMGIAYLHGTYDLQVDPAVLDDPSKTDRQQYGSTTYYLIHTDLLPLLMPLQGLIPEPILKAIDAPLRVLVELGYDRKNYGAAAGAGWFKPVNPIQVVKDMVDAFVNEVRGKTSTASVTAVSSTQAVAAVAATGQNSAVPAATGLNSAVPAVQESRSSVAGPNNAVSVGPKAGASAHTTTEGAGTNTSRSADPAGATSESGPAPEKSTAILSRPRPLSTDSHDAGMPRLGESHATRAAAQQTRPDGHRSDSPHLSRSHAKNPR